MEEEHSKLKRMYAEPAMGNHRHCKVYLQIRISLSAGSPLRMSLKYNFSNCLIGTFVPKCTHPYEQ